ncbi:MAG: hypothetical protein J6L74_00775, partial [Pseudomonas sp.]|nr:hypothetical protein [Pseudomonas sp.]
MRYYHAINPANQAVFRCQQQSVLTVLRSNPMNRANGACLLPRVKTLPDHSARNRPQQKSPRYFRTNLSQQPAAAKNNSNSTYVMV